ncbi:MAG: hypothetical protein JKY88_16810 [Pseudomonadales bacterium]|nr:hypothetical protein [Pseudomonadales bacterium]
MPTNKQPALPWKLLTAVAKDIGQTPNALREYIKKGKLIEEIHWIKFLGRIYINQVTLCELMVSGH